MGHNNEFEPSCVKFFTKLMLISFICSVSSLPPKEVTFAGNILMFGDENGGLAGGTFSGSFYEY